MWTICPDFGEFRAQLSHSEALQFLTTLFVLPLPRADLAAWHVDGAVSERAGEVEEVLKAAFMERYVLNLN